MTRPPASAVVLVALLGPGGCNGCPGADERATAPDPPTAAPLTSAPPTVEPAAEPLAEPTLVTFEGSGAFTLHGSYWSGPAGAPAVILLHQLGADRGEWAPLIVGLVEAGFSVLAYDQRGHGASTRAPDGSRRVMRALTREDWAAFPADAQGALRWLEARETPPAAVVLGGSSVGSSAALVAGADEERVAGVFALSPGRRYRGIDAVGPLPRYRERPIFAVAAELEAASVDMLGAIDRVAPTSETLVLEGATAHGLRLLRERPELAPRLVSFVRAASQGNAR